MTRRPSSKVEKTEVGATVASKMLYEGLRRPQDALKSSQEASRRPQERSKGSPDATKSTSRGSRTLPEVSRPLREHCKRPYRWEQTINHKKS